MATAYALADAFAWADPWLQPWFTLWGMPFSSLEGVACALSLAMVVLNFRVHPLAWPLAIASSLLYGVVFARYRLYGEAALQLVFVALSLWGWTQWLWGRDAQQAPLRVRSLSVAGRWQAFAAFALLWPALGLLLDRATDSDVPWWDALPTSGSLVGQWLLARKWVDNWPCWVAVNVASVALFAHKGLWLTVGLYAVFAVLSVWGWRTWAQLARRSPVAAAGEAGA